MQLLSTLSHYTSLQGIALTSVCVAGFPPTSTILSAVA